MKVNKWKLVIFLCIFTTFVLLLKTFILKQSKIGVCNKVIDGDTLEVDGAVVRLKGIDAPEINQKSYDGIRIGEMSRRFLERKVLNQIVHVDFRKVDLYQRILGEVYIGDEDINLLMIQAGMAIRFLSDRIDLKANQYKAHLKGIGIFGTKGFKIPKYYRMKMNRLKRKKLAVKKQLVH